MIGTRHEKAVIVLTSYVIGFTTAFIAFGLTNMHYKGDMYKNYGDGNMQHKNVDYKKEHKNISAIGTDEDGLFVTVGGYNRIISGKKASLEASVIKSMTGPGYAYEHHKAVVSNDGWFAFYCEQAKEEVKECLPFVYSLFDDTVHTVTLDGTQRTLDTETFTVAWSDENYLLINDFISKNTEKPWYFESVATSEVSVEVSPEESEATTEETPVEVSENAERELTEDPAPIDQKNEVQ